MDEHNDPYAGRTRYDQHSVAIDEHLAKYYEDDEVTVFHEIVSLDFHLDVYFVQSEQHNFNILLTAGMSSMAMMLQDGIEDPDQYKFAELMLLLPKDIEFGNVQNQDSQNGWIVNILKQTARFPHHYDTWLGIGHSIQNDEDGSPYHEESKYMGAVVLPSVTFEDEFTALKVGDNLINIYSLFPIYQEELQYKIDNGYNDFLNLLIDQDVDEIFEFERKSLV